MRMQNRLSRRDFLRLAGWLSVPLLAGPLARAGRALDGSLPNVLVLVFDAWAAGHLPLYGYARETMPNLERFAERALVYHRHYSAGTFTATGTASLLTGTYPWEHRAFHIRSGIQPDRAAQNLFSLLEGTHATLGYSQNKYADKFLFQFAGSLDRHPRQGAFNLQRQSLYDLPPFRRDGLVSFTSFEENIFHRVGDFDASLFLGPVFRSLTLTQRARLEESYRETYPKGLPDSTELFSLEGLVDGALETLAGLESPSLVYMHFYPPHWPYLPTARFQKAFRGDGYLPVEKPSHPLAPGAYDRWSLSDFREKYDAFLASWDDALGRLFAFLRESPLGRNSYVFLTSDHGEMFERSLSGHTTPLIYDPLVRVPLLVSAPGQVTREDVHAGTSSLDLLPTIAHLCGLAIPSWAGGRLLPGLGGAADAERAIYTLDAKDNSAFGPLQAYSVAMTRGLHRLTRYHYPHYQGTEFYDLAADPEELRNLYPGLPAEAREMEQELLDALQAANARFSGR